MGTTLQACPRRLGPPLSLQMSHGGASRSSSERSQRSVNRFAGACHLHARHTNTHCPYSGDRAGRRLLPPWEHARVGACMPPRSTQPSTHAPCTAGSSCAAERSYPSGMATSCEQNLGGGRCAFFAGGASLPAFCITQQNQCSSIVGAVRAAGICDGTHMKASSQINTCTFIFDVGFFFLLRQAKNTLAVIKPCLPFQHTPLRAAVFVV